MSGVRTLDTRNAEPARSGRDYVDVPDLPRSGPLGQIFLKALTDDGGAVVTTGPAPSTDGGTLRIHQSTVGTLRGKTFTPFPQPVAGPARSAVHLDTAGRHTAWMETTSTDLDELDWMVFLYDARTRRTRLLGDSRDVAPVRPLAAVGETDPSVGSREVFWAATAPRGQGGFDDLILGAPLDGPGTMRKVVVGGYYPAADGTDLLYVSSTHLDRNEAYSGRVVKRRAGRYEIRRLRGGRTTVVASGVLAADQSVSGLTAHNGSVAYVVSSRAAAASTLVLLEPGGKRTNIRLDHSGGSFSVELSDRLLA